MKYLAIAFFLLILISITSYFLYENVPGTPQNLKIEYQQELPRTVNASSEVKQFVQNMRFNHNDLSYSFNTSCSEEQKQRIEQAFLIIHQKTAIISFYQTNQNPDIDIVCSEDIIEKQENTFLAGEGGPTQFINNTLYPLISKGMILLYKQKDNSEKCDEPLVELHELLHVFGFEHLNDSSSIMYPYLSCDQKLNPEFITYLIKLYSIEPKAELFFRNITAVKSGRYLNFEVSIENKGMINAKNITLRISAPQSIKDFDFNEIEPGSYKKLTVENLKLPSRSTNEATFSIVSNTKEYYTDNNAIKMQVSS